MSANDFGDTFTPGRFPPADASGEPLRLATGDLRERARLEPGHPLYERAAAYRSLQDAFPRGLPAGDRHALFVELDRDWPDPPGSVSWRPHLAVAASFLLDVLEPEEIVVRLASAYAAKQDTLRRYDTLNVAHHLKRVRDEGGPSLPRLPRVCTQDEWQFYEPPFDPLLAGCREQVVKVLLDDICNSDPDLATGFYAGVPVSYLRELRSAGYATSDGFQKCVLRATRERQRQKSHGLAGPPGCLEAIARSRTRATAALQAEYQTLIAHRQWAASDALSL
jgi:hypothetical protein